MANSRSIAKTVLITGCSNGGIGAALAVEFQKRGYIVFGGVRDPARASSLASLSSVTLVTLDVTSKASIDAAVQLVEQATDGRGLDVLVNNAGHGAPAPLLDVDLDAARKLFDVNFWGALQVTQAFARLVIAAKGTIVNICSMGADVPSPYLASYGASKAALKLASDTLRLEL
jgi:1-acylglycerone phosphate reductase